MGILDGYLPASQWVDRFHTASVDTGNWTVTGNSRPKVVIDGVELIGSKRPFPA
jgi:hypothetical protein